MRILYIWDSDYPWDVRVEKICESLYKDGHEVHIISRNLRKQITDEIQGGIHIHRLKYYNNTRLNNTLSFPAFFSPVWNLSIRTLIKKHHIDLIIVRDLPMAIAGIWAGKRNNIPVIFDMAEDYVAMIRDIWKARKFQSLNLIVRNPYFAKMVEKYVLKNSDQILVVVKEAKTLLINRGVDDDKISIISNTPPLSMFSNSYVQMNPILEQIKSHYSAIYTGGIQMGRGIQIVLEAIPVVIKQIPEFLFVIVGDGYAVERLKKIALDIHIEKYVLWTGWVDHNRVFDFIKMSDVGIIPHIVTEHVNTTIPNKIFDYMGLGLPVVASDAIPMKRILNDEKSGIIFKNNDSSDLAESIIKIYRSNSNYGNNGINAIREKYNWDIETKKLLNITDSLMTKLYNK